MSTLDLWMLDRDVRQAAAQERAWLRRVRADADASGTEPWFEPVRYVTTRSTFEAASALLPGDPFREPLRRWIHRLAIARIAQAPIAQMAMARQRPIVRLESPEPGVYSARELLHRALSERDTSRRRLWLAGIPAASPEVASAERRLRDDVIEITARLGAGDGSSLLPYQGEALREAAREFLARTRELARALLSPHQDLGALIGALLAREVAGVWPGGSLARWTVEQFRATPLLEGITLDLGPVPATLGASSFARVLARFGAAYARAAPATGPTFVHAHDPSELGAMRRGALFGCLLADPAFLRQTLGLSKEVAASAARELAPALLVAARLDAVRTLTDLALAPASQVEDAVHDALQVPFARGLASVVPRPSARAPLSLLGSLLARGDAAMLRERFDQDWFRNPHALRYLREVDAGCFAPVLPKEAIEGTAAALAAWFEQLAA
jgi:hypothetical protein